MRTLAMLCAVPMFCCAALPAQTASPVSAAGPNSLDMLKGLAGSWTGKVTTDNPAMSTDKPLPLTIRVVSKGNAIEHTLDTGGPEVTMLYLDGGKAALLHYCDFGNTVKMTEASSGKPQQVAFNFASDTGSEQVGHVTRAVFTSVDANHHTEDWVFDLAKGNPIHAHMDFVRVP